LKSRQTLSLLIFIFFIILSGCGGGGGGSSSGTPSTPEPAGTIDLAWDAPTTDADGNPLTDLAGYWIYYGTSSGTYPDRVYVGNVTTYTLTGLTPGQTYYIAATAIDTSNNESSYSNEISGTAD